jgi:hypothetical protein
MSTILNLFLRNFDKLIIPIQSLVLGNICSSFSKPATMDLKIGTKYYDDDASPEKRERKMADAAKTTAVETGAKITGFQVRVYRYLMHCA